MYRRGGIAPALSGATECFLHQETGAKLFATRCAACHGLDGQGGERGPGIVEMRRSRARTPEALREVIVKGVPEAGMPPFTGPAAEADALVAFVTSVRAPGGRRYSHVRPVGTRPTRLG
ncbi:MAG: c-type cytochrome [Bryobacteraceae bacterium]